MSVRRVAVIAAVVVVSGAGAALGFWMRREPPRVLEPNWNAVVFTVAGGAVHGFTPGNPYEVRFSDPFGIASTPDGTIYVADGVGAHRIYRISPERIVSVLAGSHRGFADGSGSFARFNTPSGLAVDAHGTIYVADTGNDAIRRISADGTVSTVAGPGAGLNGPVGVALDASGRVIVADTYNDRIVAIAADGTISTVAGTNGPGFEDGTDAKFHTPCGVAADSAGNIYVADTGNGAVRLIAPDGAVSTVAASGENGLRPLAVAVGRAGSVFVADARGRIIEITSTGEQRTVAGSRRGFADGQGDRALFRAPSGIAVAGPGRLVVTDRRNGLVRLVAATSQLEVIPPAPPLHPQFDTRAFDRTPLLWPFAPVEGPFEVTGTLGEPRGVAGAERFHAGLDVHAPEGTPVHAVREGDVDDPLASNDFESLVESVRVGPIAYVHVRVGREARGSPFDDRRFVATRNEAGDVAEVRVKRGAHFDAGDAIGTVNRFYHAHLNVGWPGEEVNPLLFDLLGFEDTIPPVIARGGIRLIDEGGAPLTKRERQRLLVHGRVRIVVDAWDQVNGNLPRRRLGLYRLGYQVLDASGAPVDGFEAPRETIQFDRHPGEAEADSARIIYAPGSGIPVYGNRRTRYLYVVTSALRDGVAVEGTFDSTALAPGDYIIRVLAADASGNEALRNRDVAIRVVRPSNE